MDSLVRLLLLQFMILSVAFSGEPNTLGEALATPTPPLEPKTFKVTPLSGDLFWSEVGPGGVLRPVEGRNPGLSATFSINNVSVEYMGIVLGYAAGDVMGAYRFRHVPSLPGDEVVKGIEEIRESRRQLGKPIVEYWPQRVGDSTIRNVVWSFLQAVPDGKYELMVVRIWFGEDGRAVGKWIGRGAIEEVSAVDPGPESMAPEAEAPAIDVEGPELDE